MHIYRLIMALALPVLIAVTLVARLAGRLPAGALRERLGFAPGPQGSGPRLWLHGASLGEIGSAQWLVERLCAEVPGLQVLVTANTATARAMVRRWGTPGVSAAFAPFDAGGAAARVIRRWRPAALIVLENELWPGRIAAAGAAGVPVIVIGARLSARSARGWGRAPGFIAGLLSRIRYLSAQDEASQARFLALGLPPERLGPRLSIKALAPPPPPAPPPFPAPAPRDRIVLAASTHEGEDEIVLDAFAVARAAGAFSHLILAPRHLDRSDAIAALIRDRGLPFARRSVGEVPGPDCPVLLADTLGEMPLWYAMAGVTVIGRSLAGTGGHSPYEPAAMGSAIVHGPVAFKGNSARAFGILATAGGAVALADPADLGATLAHLDAGTQQRLAAAAQAAFRAEDGADALVAALRRIAGLGAAQG